MEGVLSEGVLSGGGFVRAPLHTAPSGANIGVCVVRNAKGA